MEEKKRVYETELTFVITRKASNKLALIKHKYSDKVTFEILNSHEYVTMTFDLEQLECLEILLSDSVGLATNHFTGIIQNYTRLAIRRKKLVIESEPKDDFYFLELGGAEIRLNEHEYKKLIDVITGLQYIIRKSVA